MALKILRVALDVPLASLFDYAQPEGIEAEVGDRVVVPFGARQRLGVVIERAQDSAFQAKLKPIAGVRDDAPRLGGEWLALIRFLATYYQRPLGETAIGALPPR
ncbi:MAG: primosomal protein N', partial [Burkholderiales bacterium]